MFLGFNHGGFVEKGYLEITTIFQYSAFMMHGVLEFYEDRMFYLLGEYIMEH